MSRKGKMVFAIVLLLIGCGGIAELQSILRQRAQVAAQRTELARLDAEIQRARQRFAETKNEAETTGRARATARAEIAAFESSPAKLWSSRIRILQQLLEELPGQRIPELKLLDALDWIEVARNAELDTPGNIRAALAALRAMARQKFVKPLQEALRQFTDASGGELPADIHELARFLAAPADAGMLERYGLTRSGRLGAKDENLIVEKPISDLILSVSLDAWSMTTGPNLLPAPGESEMDAFERAMAAMGTAAGDEEMKMVAQVTRGLAELLGKIMPQFDTALGDSFGDEMKQAVKRFGVAHASETPTNFAQILPYLNDPEKFIAVVRPVFAQVDYVRDHEGQLPTDPAQWRRYLEKPFNAQEALRAAKLELSADGEHGSLSFSWGTK